MNDLLHRVSEKTNEIRDLAFNKFPFTKVDRVNDLCDEILEIIESYTEQVVDELAKGYVYFDCSNVRRKANNDAIRKAIEIVKVGGKNEID